ncbi:MAG: VacJ family lipoprotein [Desulfoferrobacter sp.]
MKAGKKALIMSAVAVLVTLLLPALKGVVSMNLTHISTDIAHAQALDELYPVETFKAWPEVGGEVAIADPLQPFNQAMFKVNDRLYFWFLKPVGKAYAKIIPETGRIGLRNAFYNFLFPVRFVNNILQLKIKRAGAETARFVLNSTFGFAGFYDFVGKQCTAKLGPYDEDFGQTLGFYGMKPIFYVVWPVIGPSSLRDSFGLVGDAFADPTFYLPIPWYGVGGIKALQQFNAVSLRLGEYEDFLKVSLDPYVAMRNAYIQYRENLVKE